MTTPFTPNVKDVFDYLWSLTEEDSEDEDDEFNIAHFETEIWWKSV